ncbi:MAG: NAD-dependent epimerase/dehydratase family protein [Myxococcales bacterium]|nr:NAD-dependent epimerase/dehydratase family protein [Myxococcales bacterium]
MSETVLVTGGSGFIGRHLVQRLLDDGQHVIVVSRRAAREIDPPLPAGAQVLQAGFEALAPADEPIAAVFHLAAAISFAAGDFAEVERVNVGGTRALLEWAQASGVADFVFCSTAATCTGPRPRLELADEHDVLPERMRNGAYGYPYSKWLAEAAVREAAPRFRRAVIANPSTVWGAGDRTFNAGYLLSLARKGVLFWAPPGGTSVVSVHDVVDGLIAAWRRGRSGERYLLSGDNLTYRELFGVVNATVSRPAPWLLLPRVLYRIGAPLLGSLEHVAARLGLPAGQINAQMLENLFSFRCYSNARARDELGFVPRRDARAMVEETWQFYLESGLLPDA